MLTYNQLIEITLNQLKPNAKLDDLEKAAGSQGIKLGKREKKGHHVDYPDAKHRDGRAARTQDNKVIGGTASGDKGSSKMEKGTHQKKLKDAVIAGHKPRVNQKAGQENVGYWKNPDRKDERIADAKKNKAAKAKKRDPFTREHSEWWLNMWRLDEAMDGTQEKNRRVKQMAKPKPGAPVGGTKSTISAAKPSNTMKRSSSFGAKPTTTNTKGPNMSPEVAVARTKKTQAAPKGPAMNSDVEAARRRRKAQEANVRPAASANSDVAAARAKRKEGEKNRLADAGGSALKTGQQGPKTRTRAVQDQRDAQVQGERERQAELNRPKAQAPRRPGQAEAERKAKEAERETERRTKETERKARDKRVDSIRNKKTNKQMAQLNRDKQGVGGQLKSMAGGDMFIRDKKTDTQDTRDRKASMRNKARGDFAKKKVQQTGNLAKSTGRKALDLGKKGWQGEKMEVSTEGPSGNSQGSQLNRRGERK